MTPTTEKTDKVTRKLKIGLLLVLSVVGLYYAQALLKPICFGVLLAMLLLPSTKWLESKNLNQYVAAFLSSLAVVIIIGAVGGLLWWQISDLAQDTTNIERTFNEWKRQGQRFTYNTFGLNYTEQNEILDEQQSALTSFIPKIMEQSASTAARAILVLVYSFLFLTHRQKIKHFVMKISGKGQEDKTKSMIESANQVSVGYLTGLLKLIFVMTVLFSVGYWIIGVENPILFAAICGIMELIPFIGNILGTLVTSIGVIAQGTDTSIIAWVFVVYFIVQFLQSYVLEPLIVGSQVNVNPLFSILALMVGELMWGLSGLVLAIPMLGILKIYFDHSENLKPYGQLIGTDSTKSPDWIASIKGWFNKKTDTD